MKPNLSSTSRNTKLGLAVCALGLAAAFAGSPYRGGTVTLDATELAGIVGSEADHVDATDLADWIIQGRADYRLIDLRAREEYDRYHIPGAESVPLAGLPEYGLGRNEKIVLYSGGGIHSAQAWFLLRAMGYRSVYMLLGGLEDWKDSVLYPVPPPDSDPGRLAEFSRRQEVSRFFGGAARSEGVAEDPGAVLPLPKLQSPASPAPPTASGSKKKQGC
jgi:rhodanese-related sulfurtransferase